MVRRASLYHGRGRNLSEGIDSDCWSGQRGASELFHLIPNPPDLGGEQEEDEHDPAAVAGEQPVRIVGDHRPADTAAGASPRLLAYQPVALPAHPVAHAASPVQRILNPLRSITLTTAEAAGLADRYGSLETGKVANVVVWTGDPLEFSSRVEHLYIRGREIPLVSRQTELLGRYRKLPPSY